jgi:hypothetical protein
MEQDLLRLIRNDSERLEMGHRAREYAIKHHSPENIRVLLDLFEAAVS